MTKLVKTLQVVHGAIQAAYEAQARGESTLPEDLVFEIDAETEEQAAAIAELLLTCNSEEEAIAMIEDLNRRMTRH